MFRDPRGRIIHDRGQELVGAVREVYCDPATHQAEYAEVALARRLGSEEDVILYPWEGLRWSTDGSFVMNDWIWEALSRGVHSYERIMHTKAHALETLDQALLSRPSLSL